MAASYADQFRVVDQPALEELSAEYDEVHAYDDPQVAFRMAARYGNLSGSAISIARLGSTYYVFCMKAA